MKSLTILLWVTSFLRKIMSKMSFNNFLGLLDFKISNLGAIKRFLLNLIRLISGDVNLRKANTFIYFLNPKVEEHNLEKVSDI